jgi:hypothetical protein
MNPTSTIASRFDHLVALTDNLGTFEHADHAIARLEHGYCTDDVARVLVVAAREPDPSSQVQQLVAASMRFLLAAQAPDGTIRNRRDVSGAWHGPFGVEDCWGRSVWAFGVAASSSTVDDRLASAALAAFERGASTRSTWPRATAFAALGAAEVLAHRPGHAAAVALLASAPAVVGRRGIGGSWPWPEPRLTYANAVLAEAMVAAGAGLARIELLDDGLALLGWLLRRETRDGHLSVTPAGGVGPDHKGPGFDQQPIEVAAMADACARAHALTGERRWDAGVRMAGAWFDGANDAGVPMWDPATGGGYDGLEPSGANQNQGAESTIALISTRQQVERLDRHDAMTGS